MDRQWQVEVGAAAWSRCLPAWRWHNREGAKDCLNIWLIIDGQGTWRDREMSYSARAGDCFIQRLWEECWGSHSPTSPMTVAWANFRFREPNGCYANLPAMEAALPAKHRRLRNPGFVEQLMERVVSRFHRRDSLASGQWMAMVWDELLAHDGHEPSGSLTADQCHRLDAIHAEICASPEQTYVISELARSLSCTPGHFTRMFRQRFGISPRALWSQRRIDMAKSYLLMSDLSISGIAEALGFCDVYHFSRRFKEHEGVSPRQYRQR